MARKLLVMLTLLWAGIGLVACGGGGNGSASGKDPAKVVVEISIDPPNPTLPVGTAAPLTATAIYSDSSREVITSAVTWSSPDETIATVDGNGYLTPRRPGVVTITGTLPSGELAGAVTVTVTAAVLHALEVDPANPALALGTTRQLTATGIYSDGSRADMTRSVSWESLPDGVAAVDGSGMVTAKSVGVTTISAASGGITCSISLTVTSATLVSLAIDPPNPTLALGTTQQLTATGIYSDGSRQDLTRAVTWNSSSPSVQISSVSGLNGSVTAAAVGTALISASLNGVTGAATLIVTPAYLVGLSVSPVHPSLALGTAQQFNATGTYSDGSTQDLTAAAVWSSSDAKVAAVSNAAGSAGKATGLAIGSTVISAASGSVSGQATLTVTPAYPVSLTITPINPQAALGTTLQLRATGTYSDGTTQDLTAAVTWASTAAGVATVSNAAGSSGKVTTVAVGSATFRAALPVTAPAPGTMSAATTLTVTPAYPVSLAISPANAQAPLGTSLQLKATGTYSDGSTQDLTAAVTWNSSSPDLAGVSNAADTTGRVTTVAAGVVTISATLPVTLPIAGTISSSATLTVTPEETASIKGSWIGTYTIYDDPAEPSEIGTYPFEMVLEQAGTTITAIPTLRGNTTGRGQLIGSVTGNSFRFSFTYISPRDGNLMTDTGTGTISGTTMTAEVVESYEKGYNCSYTFSLTRKP